MKKTALLIITLFISHFAFSQRGYLGFHFGGSTPVGDFASTDIKNPDAGFAKPGMMGEVSFGYKFKSPIGLAASVRGTLNPSDDASYAARERAEQPETTWNAKSNSWGMTAIMVGPYASFKLTENLSFDLRVMGGYSWAGCPTVTWNTTYAGKDSWIEQAGTKTTGFSYAAGAQLKYRFAEVLCVMAGVDYWAASLNFKEVKMTTYEGNTSHVNIKQPYSTVNATIGIGFCFNGGE